METSIHWKPFCLLGFVLASFTPREQAPNNSQALRRVEKIMLNAPSGPPTDYWMSVPLFRHCFLVIPKHSLIRDRGLLQVVWQAQALYRGTETAGSCPSPDSEIGPAYIFEQTLYRFVTLLRCVASLCDLWLGKTNVSSSYLRYCKLYIEILYWVLWLCDWLAMLDGMRTGEKWRVRERGKVPGREGRKRQDEKKNQTLFL